MKNRLSIARQLLTNSGVIAISINYKELSYLKVLCDELFGEDKLAGHLGRKKIVVRFTEDVKHLALKEDDGNSESILFPKSGSKTLSDVSTHLKRKGIAFPAKYEVWFNEAEQFWQGDFIENPTVSPQGKRQPSKTK